MGGRSFGLIRLLTFLSRAWQLAGLSQKLWLVCMILCVVMWCPNLGCLLRSSSLRVVLTVYPLCMMLTVLLECGKSCPLTRCNTA